MSKIIYLNGLYFEHKDLRSISIITKVGIKTRKGKAEEIVWRGSRILVKSGGKEFKETLIESYPGICGLFDKKMAELGLVKEEINKARLREIEIAEQASEEEYKKIQKIMECKEDE